ncbi:hypothetical protein [Calidithermus chliarophilus]|uniref:hypothetical protein n=1 Tax=Calidithermus chliarophilus TaxID=52023 RepID=UPI000404F780|nr:hypothetical protein [Calidithermus chliarophilus]
MRSLQGLSANYLRDKDGAPLLELILHTFEGYDPLTRGLRNQQECRAVVNVKGLEQLIGTLEEHLAALRAAELPEQERRRLGGMFDAPERGEGGEA